MSKHDAVKRVVYEWTADGLRDEDNLPADSRSNALHGQRTPLSRVY
ncbi:MAG: hypothetical protein WBL79_01640 [Bacillota bacterium]